MNRSYDQEGKVSKNWRRWRKIKEKREKARRILTFLIWELDE